MGGYVAPGTGHLDAALTEFAKGFVNNALVSDMLFPRVPVGRQTDKYYIFGREGQEVLQETLRAPGAPAQRVRRSLSTDSYCCDSHALAAEIADEDRAGYEPGDLEEDANQDLIDKILLDKEIAFAALVTDTSVLTQNVTLSGTDQWSDYGNSKPLTVVENGKSVIRKCGVEANTLVLGEPVYTKLINHPSIVDRFKYVLPGAIGAAQLASVFDIPQVLVARAVQVDKAGTVSFIFGKHAVLAYVQPTPSRRDPSLGKTFVWANAPGTIGGFGTVIGRHPDPTAKSDIVGVDFYYDQKVTCVEAGYLIKNAVA